MGVLHKNYLRPIQFTIRGNFGNQDYMQSAIMNKKKSSGHYGKGLTGEMVLV